LERTRVVNLRTGKHRVGALNSQTRIVSMEGALPVPARPSFHSLFVRHYKKVRQFYGQFSAPGLAITAVDDSGVAATSFLAAKEDIINVAVVGRHSEADLYLDDDPSISLRHLLVVIHPLAEQDDVRFRVLDLRTRIAFSDERDLRLEALEAEGPLFIRCGSYSIFFLPTGDDIPWPDDAEEGWECIPERVYFDDVPAEPDRWQRRREHQQDIRRERKGRRRDNAPGESGEEEIKPTTLVQTLRGPLRLRRNLLQGEEQPVGEIHLRWEERVEIIGMGPSSLAEGVLLGRYRRCDTDGLAALRNVGISRVHLYIARIAGSLYAIDTASTNGVWVDDKEVRVLPLENGSRLVLGNELLHIKWCRC